MLISKKGVAILWQIKQYKVCDAYMYMYMQLRTLMSKMFTEFLITSCTVSDTCNPMNSGICVRQQTNNNNVNKQTT